VNLTFLMLAALLIVAAMAMLLRPWQRRAVLAAADGNGLNTALYREQLAELGREHVAGSLSDADFQQARTELERRLLDDVASADQAPAAQPADARLGQNTAWVLAAVLPLAAAGLYLVLGTPAALSPQPVAAANQGPSAAQVEAMVAKLAARLAQQPNDPKGWGMLGRSYHAMGRMDEAAKAFEHVGPSLQGNATLLSDYADVLASLAGGKLAGRPSELIAQALRVAPDFPMAVELAAAAAAQRNDKAGALGHWAHLLKLLPPESDDARWVQLQIAALQGQGASATAQASVAKPAADQTAPPDGTAQASVPGAEAITGHVSLAPALAAQFKPEATLFLFVRNAQGSRMPLAIQRLTASQLPLDFKLDDSQAMNPSARLSGALQVVVEARISLSGKAMPEAGDLYGQSAVIKPGAKGLKIVIDQVR
jgi:cytochrome c-type biogenesis protein CcmH